MLWQTDGMRMKKIFLLIPLAVAGCDRGPDIKLRNATGAEVANTVAAKAGGGEMRLRPGEWRIDSALTLDEVPGAPAEQIGRLRQTLERKSTTSECLTPEEAARPNAGMFGQQNSRCTYENFEMSGGRIDATMRCPGAGGAEMVMKMDGSYAPDSYKMNAAMDMQGLSGSHSLKMTMRSTGTRVGECKPGES